MLETTAMAEQDMHKYLESTSSCEQLSSRIWKSIWIDN